MNMIVTSKPPYVHLHNVGIKVEVVLETLGQILKVPVMADLGHGDDALDADAVRIHRVDDRVQIGAVSALNLKSTKLSSHNHQSSRMVFSVSSRGNIHYRNVPFQMRYFIFNISNLVPLFFYST